MEFWVGVEVFVLFELGFELGFGDVDGRIHINGCFMDSQRFVRQVHNYFTRAFVFLFALALFELNRGVEAGARMTRRILVESDRKSVV